MPDNAEFSFPPRGRLRWVSTRTHSAPPKQGGPVAVWAPDKPSLRLLSISVGVPGPCSAASARPISPKCHRCCSDHNAAAGLSKAWFAPAGAGAGVSGALGALPAAAQSRHRRWGSPPTPVHCPQLASAPLSQLASADGLKLYISRLI